MSAGKSTNGNESRATTAAANKVASTAGDLQDDLASVQEDIIRLSGQIGDLAAAKGAEAWKMARKKIDGVIKEANAKGEEAVDAVTEARDHLLASLDEAIETRPYTTLAIALAAGFVAGAIWKR
jgi:ElaB/YqjD/DUF883 family membrane-anchored ribosome-binding protein